MNADYDDNEDLLAQLLQLVEILVSVRVKRELDAIELTLTGSTQPLTLLIGGPNARKLGRRLIAAVAQLEA